MTALCKSGRLFGGGLFARFPILPPPLDAAEGLWYDETTLKKEKTGMTHVYLIRHGESQANKIDAFLGQGDLDLTEKGHQQAKLAAAYLQDIPVDVIYSSDLQRAYHTALYTAEQKGMEVIRNRNLREIDGGEWEQVTFSDLKERYAEDYGLWVSNIGRACCTGGESVVHLLQRVTVEVEKIARENEGKTVFIFTHGTPLRVLKAAWDGKTLDEIRDIPWASNASVTHGVYDGETFRMLEYSKDSFMGELVTALPDNV